MNSILKTFFMILAGIQLHEHQKNAIAHAFFGGNTLFAVSYHLTEQIGSNCLQKLQQEIMMLLLSVSQPPKILISSILPIFQKI